MFGELSVMAWLGGAIILAIGGGAGFFVARQIKDKRTLELEQQLETTQNKLTEYQEDVNRHFLKTSLLFSKLTDNYRDVYEHLATGAQKLCNEKPLISALDLPEAKILTAAVAQEASPENATTTDINPSPAANKQAEATQPSTDSIIAAENSEAISTEAVPADTTDQAAPVTDNVETTVEIKAEAESTTAHPLATETIDIDSTNTETETTVIETKPTDDAPLAISAKELKMLEAYEKKQTEEDDIHLGAESTPGVELAHHKTHPSIH